MPGIRRRLSGVIRATFWRWLERRQPAQSSLTLRQNILYVLPTRYGLSLLALAVILYLLGSNYQNNLILLLSFLLIALLVLCILLAFQNLHGLKLHASDAAAAFAGDDLSVCITLEAQQNRQMLEFIAQEHRQLMWTLPSVVMLAVPTTQRGYFALPRFKIQSIYPFGLVRCWSYPALNQQYWVYPKPIQSTAQQQLPVDDGELQWSHLSPYQPGDALQRIDWKRLARQPGQPVVKVFNQQATEQHQLEVPALKGAALEQALSEISAQILQLSNRHLPFTLKVAGHVLTPEQSAASAMAKSGLSAEEWHRQRCLEALSLC
jgi:hypothetical protein